MQTKLTEMEQQLKELRKRSVELAEQGDVDEAHASTTQADTLEVRFWPTCVSTCRGLARPICGFSFN